MASAYRVFRLSLAISATLMASGCGAWNGWINRDIQENEIELVSRSGGFSGSGEEKRRRADVENAHAASVLGMTATRRGVMIRVNQPIEAVSAEDYANPHVVFCAEPPPDAMQSFQAGFNASIDPKDKGSATISDAYSTAVGNIAARTPVADTYRTAVYSICQLFINGALSREDARDLFLSITVKALETLATVAGKEPVAESGVVEATGPSEGSRDSRAKPDGSSAPVKDPAPEKK